MYNGTMYLADLHIHSKYSRATGKNADIPNLDLWARRKGVALVGTGDFTHPAWREELARMLEPAEEGLYRVKEEYRLKDFCDFAAPRFVVSGEISCIYKQGGKVRKVHNLILLPSVDAAERRLLFYPNCRKASSKSGRFRKRRSANFRFSEKTFPQECRFAVSAPYLPAFYCTIAIKKEGLQMKYEKWLDFWLEDYLRSAVKARTYARYAEIAENHLKPALGRYEMDRFSPLLLQRFVAYLLKNGNCRNGRGLSSSSVNAVVTVIQRSFAQACESGVIGENAAKKIVRPKIREKAAPCFTFAEQKSIENAAMGAKPKMFGIVLCLYTGLRVGELLALEWEDVDFAQGTISVAKTCYDGRGGRITDAPKTESSKRVIPLPENIGTLLKAHKKKAGGAYVISQNGAPVSVRSYQRSFELLLKKLRLPHRGFHALRHTFATRALECGMDVKTLSELLGHKNAAITLNRYAHSLLEHKRAMMKKLGRLL